MKKKFVKGLLMAAIAVAPMSFLTSCTDHEDDRFAELQIWLSDPNNLNIKDFINKEIGDLEKRLSELEDAQKRCEQNCSTIHANLDKYLTIVEGDQRYLKIDDWNTYINSIYTKDDVDRLLEGLKQCTCEKFTREDIQNIINQYLTNNQYITRQDVQNIINNFLKEYYTKTEVENLLKNYITNEYLTQNFYTKEEVMNIINNLPQDDLTDLLNRIAALEGKDVYTKSEVDALLNGKVDKAILDNYYDKTKVLELIKDFVTEEQVNNIIKGYGYLTRQEIIDLIRQYAPTTPGTGISMGDVIDYLTQNYYTITQIKNELRNYYTTTQIDQMFSDLNLDQYAKKSDLVDNRTFWTWLGVQFYDKEQIDNLIKDFITKETAIQTILDEVKNAQSELSQAIMTLINNYQYNWGNETITIQQAIDSLYKVKDNISCACGYTSAIGDQVEQNKLDIAELDSILKIVRDSVYTLNVNIGNLSNELGQVKQTANDAKALAEAVYKTDSIYNVKVDSIIEVLKNLQINNCTCDLTSLTNALDSLAGVTSNLADRVDSDSAKIVALQEQISNLDFVTRQELIDSLESQFNTVQEMLNDSVKNVRETIANVEKKLQDQIDELKPQVEENKNNIKEIMENILPTLASKEWVMEQLSKQVTGIIVNGAWNPVVGEGAAPVGLNLNVLAAYHGYTANAVRFPRIDDADAPLLAQAGLTRSDIITVQGLLFYGKSDSNTQYADAGTVYMTVNPNTVDFTQLPVALVNSQDKEAGIQLYDVKKSDHTLTWGYKLTRAADNGFYEADAKLDMTQIGSVQANIDLGSLKTLASDLRNFRTQGFNVSKIISTIYEAMGDVLDRYAIRTQYTDTLGTHKVYSGYDLAATSVKAFPFHHPALESYAYDRLPGLDRIEKFIDKLRGRLQSILVQITDKGLDQVDFINDIELYALNSPDGDPDLYMRLGNIKVLQVEVQDNTAFTINYWDSETNSWKTAVVNSADGSMKTYTVTVNISDLIEELYNDVAKPINDALDGVKDLIATFNNIDAKIDSYADRAENVLIKYLEKFNNRMVRYLDPNDYLKTTMLVGIGNAYSRVSQAKSNPTVASETSVKFLPTTFNAEIISPAYKKFVAITNVWNANDLTKDANNDASCLAALKTANAQDEIMEVIEGNRRVVKFNGEQGYVYEILYSALDFEGNVSNKKYYIKF